MGIRYIINEEKRTCVAILEDTKFDAINKINSICYKDARFNDWGYMLTYRDPNSKYVMPNRFVGVAKCSPEDTWHEDTGKKIARDKLLTKYHNSMQKQVAKFLDNMLYVADAFVADIKKSEKDL